MSDYYDLLGTSRTASAADLKRAYRNLAKQYHPDRNPGDDEAERKFKEISAAYDILKDEQKRAAYDRYGEAAFQGGGGGAAGNAGGFSAGGFNFGGGSFSDIFEDLFTGGGSSSHAQANLRGSDLKYETTISLEKAFYGTNKTVNITSNSACDSCDSSGSKDRKTASCGTCGGMGKVQMQQGFFAIERSCPHCDGAGVTIQNPCRDCGGQGRTKKKTHPFDQYSTWH